MKHLVLGLFFTFAFSFSFAAKPLPKIVVVATGGTIAMKVDKNTGAAVPALSGEDLLDAVPQIENMARVEIVNFSNISSENMNPALWLKLSKRISEIISSSDVAGIIVTHGTDSLEETAYFLDLTLHTQKPVVVIGAQRNASAWDADGPRNILNAAKVIVDEDAKGKGVLVVMNHYINTPREVTKTHTGNVQTFHSKEYGYLGYVEKDDVVFYRSPLRNSVKFAIKNKEQLPQVDLVASYTGATGKMIRHAVATGAKGIVVEAFGNGNVTEQQYDAIKEAIQAGVHVVISTRVYNGRISPIYGNKGGGATLRELGTISGDDLTPWKARVLLTLALSKTNDAKAIQSFFMR